MPIYEYECQTCGTTFEKRQGFHDEPQADCPDGHPDTRRLIAAPAIVFKGSGFYINDSKSGSKKETNGSGKKKDSEPTSAKSTEKKSEKSSSESKSDKSPESKKESSKTSD